MFTYQWCWGAEAVLFVLTEPKFTSSTPAYDFRGKKLELEAQKAMKLFRRRADVNLKVVLGSQSRPFCVNGAEIYLVDSGL